MKATFRALTAGPRHHFFGYYGICPWNASGSHLLALESDSQDHMPAPDEAARVGLVDAVTGAFHVIAETRAWNLQQGAMLHWSPLDPEGQIVFNDRGDDGEIVSVLLDTASGHRKVLPRPVNALAHTRPLALSLSYGRLGRMRKVVGYAGVVDDHADDPHPAEDGVFSMDLRAGETRLIVSIERVYRLLADRHPELARRHMWFNHLVINRSDSRFLFLARTWLPEGVLETGMFTANLDGSDLRETIPYGWSVSHFDWRDSRQIVATCRYGGAARQHILLTDGAADYRAIGEGLLRGDGHCSFSPDGQWLLTDQSDPEALERSLAILHLASGRGWRLGRFSMGEERFYTGDLRCDLHPRWNRQGMGSEGDAVCFDALDARDGTRQLHVGRLAV